ncbi:MAG: hypothetical protein CMC93_01245 [Flavobacteriaceae bacterium]|nr:hypothetical protein [Flavobacteriaceae bacterium]
MPPMEKRRRFSRPRCCPRNGIGRLCPFGCRSVFDEEAGTLGLKYTGSIPLLTQAVKELDAALKESQQIQREQQAAFDLKLAQQQKVIEA